MRKREAIKTALVVFFFFLELVPKFTAESVCAWRFSHVELVLAPVDVARSYRLSIFATRNWEKGSKRHRRRILLTSIHVSLPLLQRTREQREMNGSLESKQQSDEIGRNWQEQNYPSETIYRFPNCKILMSVSLCSRRPPKVLVDVKTICW